LLGFTESTDRWRVVGVDFGMVGSTPIYSVTLFGPWRIDEFSEWENIVDGVIATQLPYKLPGY
jgi:hypothetical protein